MGRYCRQTLAVPTHLSFLDFKYPVGDVVAPWSNYIEYGTSQPEVIALQDIGLSRHLAMYVFENHKNSFEVSGGDVVSFDLSAILESIDNEKFADEKVELEETFLGVVKSQS